MVERLIDGMVLNLHTSDSIDPITGHETNPHIEKEVVLEVKRDSIVLFNLENQRESKVEFRRRFYKYIEKAGVPRIVPHGVRHSKATMLASVCHNAEEIAVGAKFLGHSPTMFMETYVSKNGISQSDLIKRLNKGGAKQ